MANYSLSVVYVGVAIESPVGVVQSHAILLQLSADIPSRTLLTNMKQFNGKFGCVYCNNPGSTLPGKPLHRFWPHNPTATSRSHASVIRDALVATTTGKVVSIV